MSKNKASEKDRLYQIPDRYCTIAEAAKVLDTSPLKIKKLIESDMLIWDQQPNSRKVIVEVGSLMRLKYPQHETDFKMLVVKDARILQTELDTARHKIASAANLPPGAVKIYFDMGKAVEIPAIDYKPVMENPIPGLLQEKKYSLFKD